MSKAKIEVEITSEGETSVAVSGVAGKSCQDLTRAIESALGATKDSRKTAEFYKPEEKKISAR